MKRYTDTEKWESNFFSDLDPDMKLAYLYILDRCDIAGVWKGNWAVLKVFTGCKRPIDDIKKALGVVPINSPELRKFGEFADGKIWVVKFLKFQNPTGIGSNKPMVVSIRKKLEEYQGLKDVVIEKYGNEFFSKKDIGAKEEISSIGEETAEFNENSESVVERVNDVGNGAVDVSTKKVTALSKAKELIKERFSIGDFDSVLKAYTDYAEVRRKIKSPLTTELQVVRLFGKIEKLSAKDAIKAFEDATDNGWKSLYPKQNVPSNGVKKVGIEEYGEELSLDIGTGLE